MLSQKTNFLYVHFLLFADIYFPYNYNPNSWKKVSLFNSYLSHHRDKPSQQEDQNHKKEEEEEKYKYFADDKEHSFSQKIIDLTSILYSIKVLFILYIIAKVINLLNEKFIAWIILNIIIFYGPIEKRYPYFLFRSRMFVQQIFEGIIGLICCFIPAYEPKKSEN